MCSNPSYFRSFCGGKYGTVTNVFLVLPSSTFSLIPPMLRRYIIVIYHRHWGGVVVKALRCYSRGLGIDFRWCHRGFFPWLRPKQPCALGSTQPLKMITRDFSWGKGGLCVWLTTYHPRSAEREENPGP